ncbi:MAG: acetyl-CoA carboxylase biotin carboxyl carrier protein subunit [Pseudomonadota bacterium]|nr:acetyl-CoA carboxylase biotin carboxyl carrier protein subunit [Pseudomonadota bacterium]
MPENDKKVITDIERKAIKEMVDLLDELGISEIEIDNEKIGRIKVSKNILNTNLGLTNSLSNIDRKDNQVSKNEIEDPTKNNNTVNAPMIGTVYLQPEPGSKKFIEKGEIIKKGQTLLIIEAMKTMNEIVADKDGKILEILVEDEQPVQFGDPLVIIE